MIRWIPRRRPRAHEVALEPIEAGNLMADYLRALRPVPWPAWLLMPPEERSLWVRAGRCVAVEWADAIGRASEGEIARGRLLSEFDGGEALSAAVLTSAAARAAGARS